MFGGGKGGGCAGRGGGCIDGGGHEGGGARKRRGLSGGELGGYLRRCLGVS